MKEYFLAASLLCAGDSITTHAALSIGARETNHLTQNPLTLDIARAGLVTSMWILKPKVEKKPEDKKWGILISAGVIVLEGIVVTHNLQQLRKQMNHE